MTSSTSRSLCLVLALSVGLPGTTALAGPAEQTEQASLEEAERLHRQGQDRYDTADFQGAISLWTEAYSALPKTPRGAAKKPFVLYNIASAHERAFEIYGDVAQLKQARTLLVKFELTIDEIYGDPSEAQAERDEVRERIAAIDARLAKHAEQAEASGEPSPKPGASTQDEPDPPASDDGRPGRTGPDPRLVSGAVLIALGGGAGAVLLAGMGLGAKANDISAIPPTDLDMRESQFDRGRTANTMAIVGAVATPLLLGAGIALVVLAKRKPRSGRRATALTPMGLALRF